MNHPHLNCYYIDLQLFIRAKDQIPKNEGQRKSIRYGTWLFDNEIWTDIDIQIDILHRSLTLIYSHSQFIPTLNSFRGDDES